MSSERFYKPLKSIPVEGHSLNTIDGVGLPTSNIPFRDGHLDSLCRFVVDSNNKAKTSPQLVQISPAEKRTSEVQFDQTDRIIFEDNYGNLFSCLDIKGNKGTLIKVKNLNHAPSGFSFWGLQESDSIVRAIKASEYIRSLRIDTEIILKVMQPEQIPYKGKIYHPEDFKTQLLIDTASRVSTKKTIKDGLRPSFIPALALALEGMDFINTVRGKQVNERIYDLNNASPEVIRKMIERTFWFYNYRGSKLDSKEEPFSPLNIDNTEDITLYFNRILPEVIGNNYAVLHNAGVVHIHPHLQNISLLGGIYDVDSVKGSPLGLGDEEITEDDAVVDMQRLLYGYWNNQEGQGLVPFLGKLVEGGKIPAENDTFYKSIIESSLLLSYIFGRDWDKDLLTHLPEINMILNHRNRSALSFVPGYVLKILNESGQWKYEFVLESVDEIAKEMFKKKADFWHEQLKKGIDQHTLVNNIFLETYKTASSIIRKRIYHTKPEAFDSVKESKGEEAGNALLDLTTLNLSIDFPLNTLDKMYGDDKDRQDHTHALQYIKDNIN